MRERPILFSAPMVRAILAGTKTQTRRAVNPQPLTAAGMNCTRLRFMNRRGEQLLDEALEAPLPHLRNSLCPYGQPGDRLWVRETWTPDPPIDSTWASTEWNGCGRRIDGVPKRFQHPAFCLYREGWLHGDIRWRPGIHMPRWASRITLEVTGVRVERLQAISEADAIAEGITKPAGSQFWHADPRGSSLPGETPQWAFRNLWESINGPGSWDANPWVWVVEFKRTEVA